MAQSSKPMSTIGYVITYKGGFKKQYLTCFLRYARWEGVAQECISEGTKIKQIINTDFLNIYVPATTVSGTRRHTKFNEANIASVKA